jgi:hypothetical protein
MGGFIMKKKILCFAAAFVMAMSSTAFAADSGDVTDADTAGSTGAPDYEGLTAYDAAVIYEYAKTGVDYGTVEENGNYDGDMTFGKDDDQYVTASDAQLVLKVVKNPKLVTDKCLKVYTSSAKLPGGTFNIDEDLYNDDTTIAEAVHNFFASTKEDSQEAQQITAAVNKVINNMSFYSADLDRNVSLTEEGGWQIFVQAIEPLLACNGTTVYSGEHDGWIDLDNSTGDSYTNLKKIQNMIVTGQSANLTFSQLHEIFELAHAGLPGDKITTEAVKASYSKVLDKFGQKYNVAGIFFLLYDVDKLPDVDEFIDLCCEAGLQNYDKATLKDVIDNIGANVDVYSNGRGAIAKLSLYERAMNDDL